MLLALTIILGFQLAGETAVRAAGLVIPGPLLGLFLMLAALVAWPRLAGIVAPTAQGLLAHLSVLFVPISVGVVRHFDTLGEHGLALMAVIVVSTILALAVAASVFVAVLRLTGRRENE